MKYTLIVLLLVAVVVTGCSQAARSALDAKGTVCKVELYSGGELVRTWQSKGMPSVCNAHCNFRDKETDMYVCVIGDVVITQLSH